jgi:hypothetical protein
MWYSGCDAVLFPREGVDLPSRAGGPAFVMFTGHKREPQGAVRRAYADTLGKPWRVVSGLHPVTVYLVARPSAGG